MKKCTPFKTIGDGGGGGGGGGGGVTTYTTWAALDAALAIGGAGTLGILDSGAGQIGLFQRGASKTELMSPLDLSLCDGSEFTLSTVAAGTGDLQWARGSAPTWVAGGLSLSNCYIVFAFLGILNPVGVLTMVAESTATVTGTAPNDSYWGAVGVVANGNAYAAMGGAVMDTAGPDSAEITGNPAGLLVGSFPSSSHVVPGAIDKLTQNVFSIAATNVGTGRASSICGAYAGTPIVSAPGMDVASNGQIGRVDYTDHYLAISSDENGGDIVCLYSRLSFASFPRTGGVTP